MKNVALISTCFLLALLSTAMDVVCQSYTLNQSSSFNPAWANGALTGSATNVGGSAVNATQTITASGGAFVLSNGATGVPTPTVSSSAFVVGGSSACIQISMDFETNTQYTDVVIAFSSNVRNVSFNIADIDKANATSTSYFDKVTITGDDGSTTFSPAISRYVPASNHFIISGNEVYANPASGVGGNSASTAADQNATAVISFGSVSIRNVLIRYSNGAGAISNPAVQAIAIGNITFDLTTLPVHLLSFGASISEKAVKLNWEVDEQRFDEYQVERSVNGLEFTSVGTVQGNKDQADKSYTYVDVNFPVNLSAILYRLKMIDENGSFSYSGVLRVVVKAGTGTFSVFPNPSSGVISVHIPSRQQMQGTIRIIGVNGLEHSSKRINIPAGENVFPVPQSAALPPGVYVIQLTTETYTRSLLWTKR